MNRREVRRTILRRPRPISDRKKVEILFAHLKRILRQDGRDCVTSVVLAMSSYRRQLRRTCDECYSHFS